MKPADTPPTYTLYESIEQMEPGSFATFQKVIQFVKGGKPPIEIEEALFLATQTPGEVGLSVAADLPEFKRLHADFHAARERGQEDAPQIGAIRQRLQALHQTIRNNYSEPGIRDKLQRRCARLNMKEARRADREYVRWKKLHKVLPGSPDAAEVVQYLEGVLGIYQSWFRERDLNLRLSGIRAAVKAESLPAVLRKDAESCAAYVTVVQLTQKVSPSLSDLEKGSGESRPTWSRHLKDSFFLVQLQGEVERRAKQSRATAKRDLWTNASEVIQKKLEEAWGRRRDGHERSSSDRGNYDLGDDPADDSDDAME